MKSVKTILDKAVTVNSAPELEGHAKWLLDQISSMTKQGLRLTDGTQFNFGWVSLTLQQATTGELLVCAPSLDSDGVTSDLSTALQVQSECLVLLRHGPLVDDLADA
jgi:hypothetical protein